MSQTFKASEVISGTHGECWIDGEKFAEVNRVQAKIDLLKEDVPMCGTRNGKGKKNMGWEGKGSLAFSKVDSRILKKQSQKLKNGEDFIFTLVSKLADPAAKGAERVALKNCSFDDMTLIDWEANKILQEEKPFTFDDYDLIDTID